MLITIHIYILEGEFERPLTHGFQLRFPARGGSSILLILYASQESNKLINNECCCGGRDNYGVQHIKEIIPNTGRE